MNEYMIARLRNKIWVDGKVDFFTVSLLLLIPAMPATVLGLVLMGFHSEPNALTEVIERFWPVSWMGFITLSGTFIFTFFYLGKVTDHPPEMTEE